MNPSRRQRISLARAFGGISRLAAPREPDFAGAYAALPSGSPPRRIAARIFIPAASIAACAIAAAIFVPGMIGSGSGPEYVAARREDGSGADYRYAVVRDLAAAALDADRGASGLEADLLSFLDELWEGGSEKDLSAGDT